MIDLSCLLVATMPSTTQTFFWILGGLALFYLGMPLVIWWSQKFEATPRMVPFNPNEHDWPTDIDELFSHKTDEFSAAGFEVVGGVLLPSAFSNVQVAMIRLINRAEKDEALVTAMIATNNAVILKKIYVEFSTTFQDGTEYNTNNTEVLPGFPPEPHKPLNQFVQVKDPCKLYEVHQIILDTDGRHRQQKVLKVDQQFGGDMIADLLASMQEEYELAAQRDYVRLTYDGQYYRLTAKGALLMTWKELWPWKAIRRMKCDHRAQAMLSDFGIARAKSDSSVDAT